MGSYWLARSVVGLVVYTDDAIAAIDTDGMIGAACSMAVVLGVDGSVAW